MLEDTVLTTPWKHSGVKLQSGSREEQSPDLFSVSELLSRVTLEIGKCIDAIDRVYSGVSF